MGRRFPVGTWVEIESVVLTPAERAPQVPADTAQVPLQMRIKGFLMEESAIGEPAAITTVIGRTCQGVLTEVNPAHQHTFGRPVPELLTVGRELRQILEGDDAR